MLMHALTVLRSGRVADLAVSLVLLDALLFSIIVLYNY